MDGWGRFLAALLASIVSDELAWHLKRRFPRLARRGERVGGGCGMLLMWGVGLLFLFVVYKLVMRD